MIVGVNGNSDEAFVFLNLKFETRFRSLQCKSFNCERHVSVGNGDPIFGKHAFY